MQEVDWYANISGMGICFLFLCNLSFPIHKLTNIWIFIRETNAPLVLPHKIWCFDVIFGKLNQYISLRVCSLSNYKHRLFMRKESNFKDNYCILLLWFHEKYTSSLLLSKLHITFVHYIISTQVKIRAISWTDKASLRGHLFSKRSSSK